jgi:hypothetical protein
MLKRFGAVRAAYLAYVMLLLGFVQLGLFVAALAHGSTLAVAAGVGLLLCFGASAIGFRFGGAQIARASEAAGHQLSLWANPPAQEHISRYRLTYRGKETSLPEADWSPTVLVGGNKALASSAHIIDTGSSEYRLTA